MLFIFNCEFFNSLPYLINFRIICVFKQESYYSKVGIKIYNQVIK